MKFPSPMFAMGGTALRSMLARPHSTLLLMGEGAGWVLDAEAAALSKIATELAIPNLVTRSSLAYRQCIFSFAKGPLLAPEMIAARNNRLAVSYFHGYPGTGAIFDDCFSALKKNHHYLSRIQVTHSKMREYVLETGISPHKVHTIVLAVDHRLFTPTTPELRKNARERLGVPQQAVVIGSFQKDGNGWGEGLEPKLIKGPDTLLATLGILKDSIPELFVLLSGPARGYVKRGLESLGIPYRHHLLEDYADVGGLYHALDCYVVASRQEGGPKAVLESMASGIPLVTTRVGQAMELVRSGENGFMAEVEDAETLAGHVFTAVSAEEARTRIIAEGLTTANANTYMAQRDLWSAFFDGFVEP